MAPPLSVWVAIAPQAHAAGAGAEWYENTPGETEAAGERLAAEALRKYGADLPATTAKEPTIQDYLHLTLDKGLGSALLLGATVLSLYLANHAALSAGYLAFWNHHLAVPFIPGLDLSIRHWVNEVRLHSHSRSRPRLWLVS